MGTFKHKLILLRIGSDEFIHTLKISTYTYTSKSFIQTHSHNLLNSSWSIVSNQYEGEEKKRTTRVQRIAHKIKKLLNDTRISLIMYIAYASNTKCSTRSPYKETVLTRKRLYKIHTVNPKKYSKQNKTKIGPRMHIHSYKVFFLLWLLL